MKGRILLTLAACVASSLAFAKGQALVTKINVTGYTPPEYARSETCEVYFNQVVITQRFGFAAELGFTKREVRPISIDGSIKNTIAAAEKETLNKTDNFLCDAPSTTIQTFARPEPTILFESGGCGSPRLERSGPAAEMLKDLVNQYCPVTHDFGNAR